MFKLILDSYKMFLRSFPVILLFAIPLLLLSVFSIWIESSETVTRQTLYFYYALFILLPLVSVATDICLYRRFFNYSIINPLCSLKAYFLYLLTQLALGLVASAPIILFRYILIAVGMSSLSSFIVALVLNMFVGIYLLARFSILFPLIIQNKVPSLKSFSQYTARSYKEWMSVAFLLYMPYVVFNYVITNPVLNILVVNLFAFVFVCFNIKYVNTFRLPTAKAATAADIVLPATPAVKAEAAPLVHKEKKKPAVKKTTAAQSSPRKTAAKSASVSKTATAKAPKAPAKKA